MTLTVVGVHVQLKPRIFIMTLQLVKDHFFFVLLTNTAHILMWHLLVESLRQKYEVPYFTRRLLIWKQLSLPRQSWEQKLKGMRGKQPVFKFPYSVEDVLYKSCGQS